MTLPQLPVTCLDDINHRRRHREITNSIVTHQFDDSRVRTPAEIAAGVTPVNSAFPPYHAFRYMTDAQRADVQARALTQDVYIALQNCLNAAGSAKAEAYWPAGSYLISTGLTGYSNMRIVGDPRDATLLYYTGATTLSGAMLSFQNKSAICVDFIGFRCTKAQAGNATVMLHLEDCVYGLISNTTCGGGNTTATSNELTGLLIDQTTNGFVPPRGNITVRNYLYVLETSGGGASSSYGIRIKGHASESMINVVLEGEGDIEHAYYAISMENLNNSYVGPWQLRGNSSAEIRMLNCASCILVAPQVIPTPTTGTGITLDSSCIDNLLLAIGWNFSSGAPLAALVDNGTRTAFWPPGAPGALSQQGTMPGALKFTKPDGVGPNIQIVRGTTDTAVSGLEILKSGQSMGAPAFIAVDIGSGMSMDIERFEAGSTTLERMDTNGRRYLCALNSDPGAISMTPSQVVIYLDEATNNLKFRVQYANGTTNKVGTLAVV